jgi:hypothetical protein
LAGIAAREIGGRYRRYQPYPKASAAAWRDALVRLIGQRTCRSRQGHVLVRGATMRCRSVGEAKGDRTAAWCVTDRR